MARRRWSSLQSASLGGRESGVTLLEIIIVIALLVFVYAMIIPQFSLRTGTDAAVKLGQLSSDIRNAYDLAVLSGKPHRLVFNLVAADYYLEEADRREVFMGDEKLGRDPTEEEEKERAEVFEQRFREYEDLAGKEIRDPDNDELIRPESPVLRAKDRLKGPKWTRVTDWPTHGVGPFMIIRDMQAEHHGLKQTFEELGPKARAFLYFFPAGYIERAVIHIAYRKGESEFDEDQPPYTLVTDPNGGTADITSGYKEIDVHSDKEALR